jgi:hypothetical protein
MATFKGIAHVHSNFSYDGVHTVDELAAFGRACGYTFMAMSEHSDTLDPARMAVYVAECARVSGDGFVMIPGIEFTCEGNLHVIGLGVQAYTDLKSPDRVAQFVRERGGVPVVAHPMRYLYRVPSGLAEVLGGVEVWNASYDGRFVPDAGSLELLHGLRQQNASILAFAGQDLHRWTGPCKLTMTVRADRPDGPAITGALARGDFAASNGLFRLEARRAPGALKSRQITAARRAYDAAKRVRDALEAWRLARVAPLRRNKT